MVLFFRWNNFLQDGNYFFLGIFVGREAVMKNRKLNLAKLIQMFK